MHGGPSGHLPSGSCQHVFWSKVGDTESRLSSFPFPRGGPIFLFFCLDLSEFRYHPSSYAWRDAHYISKGQGGAESRASSCTALSSRRRVPGSNHDTVVALDVGTRKTWVQTVMCFWARNLTVKSLKYL
jgi:hypothetical protein